MKLHGKTKVIESYRGAYIMLINFYNPSTMYYGVAINSELSNIALASVQACKNVIDTYQRNLKR